MKLLALPLILPYAACVTTAATSVVNVPFTASDVEWSKASGTATVEGQAFLKTRGGDVKYGAGE